MQRAVGHSESEALLARFPKTRPVLPEAYARIYDSQYLANRSGATAAASLGQQLESWMHRQVAADARARNPGATLELGAGTLNQTPYEPLSAPYDVVEPYAALYADSPNRARIRDIYADIADVPADRRYARITSVAALEHICDLPLVLARAAQLLAPEGELRVAIPSEGGLVWRLGWTMTTGLEFRAKHGLDYGVLMAHEHVNDAAEIEALIGALFETTKVRALGLGIQASVYRFIAARAPRLDVAADWIRRFAPPQA